MMRFIRLLEKIFSVAPYRHIGLLSVGTFLVLIATQRHARVGIYNYHSSLWADQACYYVYLPLVFIYHLDARQMPEDIESRMGDGFSRKGKILKTKCLCGVALLQSPFFMIVRLMYRDESSYAGFGLPYHMMVDFAGITYTLLGLILLYTFLRRYVTAPIAFLSTVCTYITTNFLYYSIVTPGMSHVYSFFLFTAYLHLSDKILRPTSSLKNYLLFGVVAALIILVRPINVLFFPVIFFLRRISLKQLLRQARNLLFMALVGFIICIPQMLYWKYAYGKFLVYSYQGEGFTNWPPELLKILFAPKNSLFVYAPLTLLALLGIYYVKNYTLTHKLLAWGYFLGIATIFSAWHAWHYGCSYGCRPFVEYLSILSLPLAIFFEKVRAHKIAKYATASFAILAAAYSLKLTFSYDMCWHWGDWEWKGLLHLLTGPTW